MQRDLFLERTQGNCFPCYLGTFVETNIFADKPDYGERWWHAMVVQDSAAAVKRRRVTRHSSWVWQFVIQQQLLIPISEACLDCSSYQAGDLHLSEWWSE